MFGLTQQDIQYMIGFARLHLEVEAIGIFGSRATDRYKAESDIDIVLYGRGIDFQILERAQEYFENRSPYPFFVDISHYERVHDPVFKHQIDSTVKLIWVREPCVPGTAQFQRKGTIN